MCLYVAVFVFMLDACMMGKKERRKWHRRSAEKSPLVDGWGKETSASNA
jgi:hypothetical protein